MFARITLENFKSFKHIVFDLKKTNNLVKKIAYVYGENGAGKTNLLSSFFFLEDTMATLSMSKKAQELFDSLNTTENPKAEAIEDRLLTSIISRYPSDLKKIVNEAKMIGAEDGVKAKYDFYLSNKKGSYEFHFNKNNELVYEKFCYVIHDRPGVLYEIKKKNDNIIDIKTSPSLISNKNYQQEIEHKINQYWGKHTFLSMVGDEMDRQNEQFSEKVFNSHFLHAFHYLNSISVYCKEGLKRQQATLSVSNPILHQLAAGIIPKEEIKSLFTFEKALKQFFTRLYSDIKNVFYKTEKGKSMIRYELYLVKYISGELREIPFTLESQGTHQLLELFPFFYECIEGRTVIVDEIDTGIHDLLIATLLTELEEEFTGQFIASTHNTLLLERIDPANAYILQVDNKGNKNIECIKDINKNNEKTTQKNHNNRDRYLAGWYEGIPYLQGVYFDDIVHQTKLELEN